MQLKHLFFGLMVGSAGLALPAHAQTTDSTRTAKPALNTAPPAGPAPASRPVPAGVPAPAPAAPDTLPPAGQPAAPAAPRRFFLYSNFGLGYSGAGYAYNQFSFSVAPAIGFRVTEKLALGPGVSYAYNHFSPPRGYSAPSYSTNSVGVKGFLQYQVYQQFFLHAEYESTRAEVLFVDSQGNLFVGKTTVQTPLLGVGYRNKFGERAAGDLTVLYNFNDGRNDIYGQPVVRFSFLFDLF